MSILEIILISIALSLDAFAVAICKGIYINKKDIKKYLTIGLYFGVFQAIMPIIGYLLSLIFKLYFINFAKFIAITILFIIGFQMLREGLSEDSLKNTQEINLSKMFTLALATSIDALAMGVSFSFLNINIILASIIIGIITFINSSFGAYIGKTVNNKFGNKSLLIGGIILILLAIKTIIK